MLVICPRFSQDFVRSVASPLAARREACAGCVDDIFMGPWLQRLLSPNPAVARKAHQALCDILACAPMTSAKCERKHLLGQDSHPGGSRGRALKPGTLAKVTYAKSVCLSSSRARRQVFTDCLGESKKTRRAFASCVSSSIVGRWRRAEDTAKALQQMLGGRGSGRRGRLTCTSPSAGTKPRAATLRLSL